MLMVAAFAGLATHGAAHGQSPTYCVIPSDSTWPTGRVRYDLDNHARFRDGTIAARSYPVIRNVKSGSAS